MLSSLVVENVRCFAERQKVRLAPLTILVGENSCGKSTFLALCRLAWDALFTPVPVDFNEEPFSLGAFNEIAHYRGGRFGRVESFAFGVGVHVSGRKSPAPPDDSRAVEGLALAKFQNKASQPWMTEIEASFGPLSVEASRQAEDKPPEVTVRAPSGALRLDLTRAGWAGRIGLAQLAFLLERHRLGESREDSAAAATHVSRDEVLRLSDLLEQFRRLARGRPYAVAPIRTQPERTYHPTSFEPRPGGAHVPMVLNRLASGTGSADNWEDLANQLKDFGKACSLFVDVGVRNLGKSESDPFQLQVKITGPHFNLVDVGYGVSQVLPILVDALTRDAPGPLLLQQPEVHLHPRAQAELASFLAQVSKRNDSQFIIETHSDHFVDRIRMDIRDGRALTATDVSLLYFERGRTSVTIHELEIDSGGNIVDPPGSYRDFFLNEELRLLKG